MRRKESSRGKWNHIRAAGNSSLPPFLFVSSDEINAQTLLLHLPHSRRQYSEAVEAALSVMIKLLERQSWWQLDYDKLKFDACWADKRVKHRWSKRIGKCLQLPYVVTLTSDSTHTKLWASYEFGTSIESLMNLGVYIVSNLGNLV